MSSKNRGFASMTLEKRKMIASSGGKAAHKKGTAHRFTHEEAVINGKKSKRRKYGTTPSHL